MKNTIRINVCLAFLTVIGFALNANTNTIKANDTLQLIEIKGKISKKNNENGNYRVELLYNSVVVDSKVLNDEQSFFFTLSENKNYTVKIDKKGYDTKFVSIGTNKPALKNTGGLYRYEFVVDLEVTVSTNTETLNESNNSPYFNGNRKYSKKVRPLP